MSNIQNSGRAVIEGENIVIRIAISALPVIVEWVGGPGSAYEGYL